MVIYCLINFRLSNTRQRIRGLEMWNHSTVVISTILSSIFYLLWYSITSPLQWRTKSLINPYESIRAANCVFQIHGFMSWLRILPRSIALWFWTQPAKVLCVPFISSFCLERDSHLFLYQWLSSRYTRWLQNGSSLEKQWHPIMSLFALEASVSDHYGPKRNTEIWDHRTPTPLNPRLHEEEKLLCSLTGFYSNPFIHQPHPQFSISRHNIFRGQKVPK